MDDREKYRVREYRTRGAYATELKTSVFPTFQFDGGVQFQAYLYLAGPGMTLFHHTGASDAREAREAVRSHIERLIESLTQMRDMLRAPDENSAVSE